MFGTLKESAKGIWNTIKDVLKGLPRQMLEWGKDMIQGLIDGIWSMIGSLGGVVGKIADKITSFLHFSRPDEGPLREYESWMPDMVDGLSNSLRKASPQLISETRELAQGMSDALNIQTGYSGASRAGGNGFDNMVSAFKEALSEVNIVLNDEVAGEFVDKTVTKLIYT